MSKELTTIGNYEIIELVGEGGLGKVFKARNLSSGQIVALKLLHERYGRDERFLGVFHRELMMHRTVSHHSLVPILDNQFEPPQCFIVSRFVDGWAGRGVIKHFGRMPPLVVLSLMVQIAAGLDALHLRDLVHADLSAANILVEKTGKAFLTDFSLTSDVSSLQKKEHIFGTPGYYSPEHLTSTPVTPASDIYVIGLLIWEMINGVKLIPALEGGKQTKEILSHMMNISFRELKCTSEPLVRDLLSLLRMMVHPQDSKRYENGEKLGRAIDTLLKKYGINNPQAAVVQFLGDGLLPTTYKVPPQNIYLGYAPYTIEDLPLLNAK
ncbi:MAG: serine/threonine protein kinase [Proteobacteria bacterium]|nr:MAG: serine/threonine protein kinase [Pseudomonadota bacterium]